jgi:hypothetical protein
MPYAAVVNWGVADMFDEGNMGCVELRATAGSNELCVSLLILIKINPEARLGSVRVLGLLEACLVIPPPPRV